MLQIFVDPSARQGDLLTVQGSEYNHIRNVLRMRPGEQITVASGDGWEYICELTDLRAADTELKNVSGKADTGSQMIYARILDAQKAAKELPSRITLLQCLPKSDKMELVIQKAVELGVSEVIPVMSSRCVVKLDPKKAAAKTRRWNAVAESAAKQSKRSYVPEVQTPVTFSEALRYLEEQHTDVKLIPYECAEGMKRTREILDSIRPGQSVAVLIGPEGGFSENEVRDAADSGFEVISLGGRILRTETAGLCVLSALMLHLDDTV